MLFNAKRKQRQNSKIESSGRETTTVSKFDIDITLVKMMSYLNYHHLPVMTKTYVQQDEYNHSYQHIIHGYQRNLINKYTQHASMATNITLFTPSTTSMHPWAINLSLHPWPPTHHIGVGGMTPLTSP